MHKNFLMYTLTVLLPRIMKIHSTSQYSYLNQVAYSRSKKLHSLSKYLLRAYYIKGVILDLGGKYMRLAIAILGHDFFDNLNI